MSALAIFIWAVIAVALIALGIWMDARCERRRRRRMVAVTREENMKLNLKRWIVGKRWKGELYPIPTIRLGWGQEFDSDPRLYWIGIYWLQWSVHFGLVEVRPRIW